MHVPFPLSIVYVISLLGESVSLSVQPITATLVLAAASSAILALYRVKEHSGVLSLTSSIVSVKENVSLSIPSTIKKARI